jgi:hypothetical protein
LENYAEEEKRKIFWTALTSGLAGLLAGALTVALIK